MKKLIILLALFAFVGLSNEVAAQQAEATKTETTVKKATATKVPLNTAKTAKKSCCASKGKSASCSKSAKTSTASAATKTSMSTKATATEKKACSKDQKAGCCAKKAEQGSTTSIKSATTGEKIVNKAAPKAEVQITHRKTRANSNQ